MGCFYGWLACGELGAGVGSARNQCYIMTIVLLSLLRAFLLSPNQTRKPFLFPLFHLSLLFCFYSFKSGPNELYLCFPPYFFLLVLVFWLTGYNLHMYFVLLYETYIRRHHHHFIIINNVIFSRTGFAGSSKKKKKAPKYVPVMYRYCTGHMYVHTCICTCTYQAYHVVVRD